MQTPDPTRDERIDKVLGIAQLTLLTKAHEEGDSRELVDAAQAFSECRSWFRGVVGMILDFADTASTLEEDSKIDGAAMVLLERFLSEHLGRGDILSEQVSEIEVTDLIQGALNRNPCSSLN